MRDAYGTKSLREIVRILFQHWAMILFVVVLGPGGTYLLCGYVAPTYRSKVSLMFKRPLSKNPISTAKGERALEVFVKAQQQIVMSDLVLARAKVISERGTLWQRWKVLNRAWEIARTEGDGRIAKAQAEIRRFLDGEVAPDVRKLLEEDQAEFEEFRDSVKLETPGGEQVAMSETFTLTVERPSERGVPDSYKSAMYAADMIADMYMARFQELEQTLNDPALRVMEDIIEAFEKDVKRYVDAYEAFVQANSGDIGVLEQLLKSGTEHGTQVVLTEVRKNDARLALELARDRAVLDAMRSVLPENAFEPGGITKMTEEEIEAAIDRVPVAFLEADIGYGEMQKELAKLEAKRTEAETQFTEASRDVRYMREETLLRRRRMLRSIVAHAKGLKASIAARMEQMIANEKLVNETAAQQSKIHLKLAEYARLKNGFEVAQRQSEKLQQEKIDALSSRLRARESVTITRLDEASMPDVDRPVTPKTAIYTVVAFLVSLLLGIAGAFLADHFDHTLRSAIEAERYLGVPVLGSIKKRGRGLVVGM